jgi:hypothetical protein
MKCRRCGSRRYPGQTIVGLVALARAHVSAGLIHLHTSDRLQLGRKYTGEPRKTSEKLSLYAWIYTKLRVLVPKFDLTR